MEPKYEKHMYDLYIFYIHRSFTYSLEQIAARVTEYQFDRRFASSGLTTRSRDICDHQHITSDESETCYYPLVCEIINL